MSRYRFLLPVVAVALSQLAIPAVASTSLPDAPPSTAIATASIDTHEAVGTSSDGDLWPSCWSNDDNLYAANGDGSGFTVGGPFADISVNRIEGRPPTLSGETLARGDAVGNIWSGSGYNRKPTGMACVDGTIYLAVQDLSLSFNDVPAATIVRSTDHGRTWTWDRSKPMFDNHVFTTIWFADFGKDSSWAPDRYLYAYGLDHNWRDSFDDTVPDPTDVYLARVPRDRVQDRRAWDFYTGTDNRGRPRWSGDIADRAPVLHDGRHVYQQIYSANRISNLTVVSQGSVTYDKPLQRYIYTSWSEYTFEFYESPTPWGPWKRFLSKDFGGYPWTAGQHGGYATTVPSKFLSADGLSMWVQSNVCPCANAGTSVYHYSLRKLALGLAVPGGAANNPDPSANLAVATGVVPVSKSARSGDLRVLNDGAVTGSVNDFDDEVKSASWWGYTWPRRYRMNQVQFTTGEVSSQGGWFAGRPSVQVRQNGEWTNATAQTISPVYPGDATAGPNQTYTISFLPAEADGVRVIGVPGGTRTFSSAAEVTARYVTQVANGGFEAPPGGPSAWGFEGNAGHGVDAGLGFAHSGANNGWIRGSGTGWSALTQQIPVAPGQTYTFSAWVRSSPALTDARFGVRTGTTVLGEVKFGATADYTQRQVTITVPSDVHAVTVYTGFFGPGTDTWIQIDDVTTG